MTHYAPVIGALLRIYKVTLSPVFVMFGVRCRHAPTCSEYAAAAITRFGLWPGMWMGFARFTRCRPGGTCGHDPIPEALSDDAHWWTPWRYGVWG